MKQTGFRSATFLIAMLSAVLAGCQEQAPRVAAPAGSELVWPSPPLAPRIRFVTTLSSPEDVGIRRGFFGNLLDFVKGTRKRRTSAPYGIVKAPDGRIYVVDTFHKAVQVFDTADGEHYWFPDKPMEGFENPIGIAAGPDGRVYVSDSRTKVVHVFADHGKRYVTAIGKGALSRPTGLAINPKSNELLVTDTLASQIVGFDTKSLRPTRFIGHTGSADKTFHYPTSIALSRDGRIYVTDSLNFRIQAFSPNFEFLRSFGKAGDSPGRFSRPKGVAVDSDGHIYVVDALFDNVQIFDDQGRLLLAFGSPGAGPGQFWLPNEIFIDRNDRIYVSDSQNQRVQVFQYLKEKGK